MFKLQIINFRHLLYCIFSQNKGIISSALPINYLILPISRTGSGFISTIKVLFSKAAANNSEENLD